MKFIYYSSQKSETAFKNILLNKYNELNNLIEKSDDIEIKSFDYNINKVKKIRKVKSKSKIKYNKKE